MIYVAILGGLMGMVIATFALAMMVQRFNQLTDPAQVQRLKGLIANGGVSDASHHDLRHGRLRNVFWLVTGVLGTTFRS